MGRGVVWASDMSERLVRLICTGMCDKQDRIGFMREIVEYPGVRIAEGVNRCVSCLQACVLRPPLRCSP